MKPLCRVWLDGKPLLVPWRVESSYAARGALGLPRGVAVAREGELPPLVFGDDGHEFHEDERYVTVHWLGEVV